MARIELSTTLDAVVLQEILELIAAATQIEGHRPVGEHKYAHLAVGATGWVGILAREQGQLIGYAHTRWNPIGATPRMAVEVVVHPQWYDSFVAAELLSRTQDVLARAGGGVLFLWVHRVTDPAATLAAQLGFKVQRELAFMLRPLPEPPAAGTYPDGVVVRTYRPDRDDAEFLRVNNTAFPDHPENGHWTAEDFAERQRLSWFDPEGLFLAWRGDRLVGFHWTKWHGHEAESDPAHDPVGEVYVLAVDPAAQGQGLGRALLATGLGHLYAQGCRRAILYVDRADAGPVHLYRTEGFTVVYEEVCFQTTVDPQVEPVPTSLLRPDF